MPNYNYKVRLHGIRAFAFDVDGVMTDGSIIAAPDGELIRIFNAKDGFAFRHHHWRHLRRHRQPFLQPGSGQG